MRSLIIAGLLIVCGVVIRAKAASHLSYNNKASKAVTDNSGPFAGTFFKNVVEQNPQKNVIASPISLEMVLAMAQYGARGNTKNQMKSALHLSENEGVSRAGYQNLIGSLMNVANVTLKIANKIFVNNGIQIKQQFTEITRENFYSEIQQVDFDRADEAVGIINKWADSQTNHIIKEILKEDDVSADTALVLCNALHFKGIWAEPFNAKYTLDGDFHVNARTTKKVPMMHKESILNNGKLPNFDATWVELPYQEEDFSMIVIIPNAVEGLTALVNGLAKSSIENIKNDADYSEVELYLPKFKIESTLPLEETLKQMGMVDMFSAASADFSGIADDSMKVDKVIQKAFIEVNEEGSEATAFTALDIGTRSGVGSTVISADRPFVIVIQKNGVVLFQGAVRYPEGGIADSKSRAQETPQSKENETSKKSVAKNKDLGDKRNKEIKKNLYGLLLNPVVRRTNIVRSVKNQAKRVQETHQSKENETSKQSVEKNKELEDKRNKEIKKNLYGLLLNPVVKRTNPVRSVKNQAKKSDQNNLGYQQ